MLAHVSLSRPCTYPYEVPLSALRLSCNTGLPYDCLFDSPDLTVQRYSYKADDNLARPLSRRRSLALALAQRLSPILPPRSLFLSLCATLCHLS